MSNIKVELVTPDSLLFSANAGYITIPAKEGEMGVLGNHAPMVVTLGGGLLKVETSSNSQENSEFFVFGGVAQITEKVCTILADEAYLVTQDNKALATLKLEDAQKDFDINKNGDRAIEYQEKLNYAQAFFDIT